jgi:hypothetical protein
MSPEVGVLLAAYGALDGEDILSQTLSIGGPDDRVGLLSGDLNGVVATLSGIGVTVSLQSPLAYVSDDHIIGNFSERDASECRQRLLPRWWQYFILTRPLKQTHFGTRY